MPSRDLHRIPWLPVVRQRFQTVEDSAVRYLKSRKDPEAMHDMRVACRRAESALNLCRDLLPSPPSKWLRKHLRQLRRLSNVTRDHEVLQKWLKEQRSAFARDFQKALKSERADERVQVVEFAKDMLRGGRFADHVQRACQIDDDRSPGRDGLRIAQRVLDELFRFLQALPEATTRPSELHKFRIASKRLRYAIECLCEIAPKSTFSSLQRILPPIQERLGELHDLDVRLLCLKRWAEKFEVSGPWKETTAHSQRLLKSWQTWWKSIAWQSATGTAVTELLRLTGDSPSRGRK